MRSPRGPREPSMGTDVTKASYPPVDDPQRGRRKVPRAVRERQMLDVAGRVFALRGFHAASIEEIAEGAGISKPMIYSYFGSKEGLYLALVRRATDKFYESVERASSTGTAEER